MFKCIAHPQLIALTHPPPPNDFVFVRLYMIIFISPFLSRNNGVAQFLFYQSAEKLFVTDVLHDMFKEPNNNKTIHTYIQIHTGRKANIRTGMHACMHAYKYAWWRIECNLHCLMHTTPACVLCLHNDFNDLFEFVVSPMILPNRLHSMQLTKIRATHSARII